MDDQRFSRFSLAADGNTVTIFVVVLAYVVALAGYLFSLNSPTGPLFTLPELLLAVLLGSVYLWLLLQGPNVLPRIFGRYEPAVFFTLGIGLVVAINYLLRANGGIWLIAMPLVAMAVIALRPWGRWLVCTMIVVALSWPILVASGSWLSALSAAFTFAAAVVFVAVFVRLTQKAEEAQAHSEALTEELESVNQQLAAYAVQAEELATTQERNRLAREIHDNLGHYLTVINVQILAAQAMMDKDPERAALSLVKAQQLTHDGLAAVRQSVSSLRESPLGRRSLREAIESLTLEVQASGVVCVTEIAGEVRPLDPRVDLTLYRSVQEALTNVRKHARASRVDLLLDYRDPAAVSLTVRDNGIGTADMEGIERFGLLGMRERVRQLGGNLLITTAPGEGFQLELTLPSDSDYLALLEGSNGDADDGEGAS